MNDSQFFTQLMYALERLLNDYVAHAEHSGELNADAARKRSLLAEFKSLVTPILDAHDTTLPKVSDELLSKALGLVATLISSAQTNMRAQATDYLRDAAMNPAHAAEAGSLLREALDALIALAVRQLAWLDERFKRTWWERVRDRTSLHVGPCDLDIRLVELMTALHTTTHDAETALRRLDLRHHPVHDLLLSGKTSGNGSDDNASVKAVRFLAPEKFVTKTSADVTSTDAKVMEDLRKTHTSTVTMVKLHATDAREMVIGGTQPGGGVDPRAVRNASVMTVRFCLIALKQAQAEHQRLVDLNDNVIDSTATSSHRPPPAGGSNGSNGAGAMGGSAAPAGSGSGATTVDATLDSEPGGPTA